MRLKTALSPRKLKYLWQNRLGYCTVCSKPSIFILTGTPETIRNHALCVRCRSCSRNRHLAKCVLEIFREKNIQTLAGFGSRPDVVVLNIAAQGAIVEKMGRAPNIICSEYFDDVKPGESKNGVLCQDLQSLTFANDTFDLLVSEDVFEHVPDYRQGFREVHRVLKRGGSHVFSIPFFFGNKTRDLFELQNGKRVLFKPIEYHGDPIRGMIPCFTYFGDDMLDFLRETGFEVRVEISRFADEIRFGTFDSFTFIARKL